MPAGELPLGRLAAFASRIAVHARALAEIRGGRKRSHWMWYVFPQARRGETVQTFNVRPFGDDTLRRGSGLFVGETGVSEDHHFLLPDDGTQFIFLEGDYVVEGYATLAHGRRMVKVNETRLQLAGSDAAGVLQGDVGIFFDWSPESRSDRRHARAVLPPLPRDAA